jgi:hypothetical protein
VAATGFNAHATVRYAAVNGLSSNDGSKGAPWNLKTALSRASPGDTVWLRGGEYRGRFTCYASGRPGEPIIYRQYPSEHVTIIGPRAQVGAITLQCHDVWLWGLEVYFDSERRISAQRGSFPTDVDRGPAIEGTPDGSNCKLINLVIHDDFSSFFGKQAVNLEIYGSIVYFSGWDAADRGHGHGLYVQNEKTSGTKKIIDNILFDSFAEGLHVYSMGDFIYDLDIEGNAVFNSGYPSATTGYTTDIIVGGGSVAPKNIVVRNNYTYHSPESLSHKSNGRAVWLGATGGCKNIIVSENYFVNEGGNAVHIAGNCRPTMTQNTIVGTIINLTQKQIAENTCYGNTPDGVRTFIRPNQFEPGRANIIIYNWDQKDAVSVDVSSLLRLGEDYELRDAQNFFGPPVLKGTFAGDMLVIPMTKSEMPGVIGGAPVVPRHTSREFGVFVLLPASLPPN